MLPPPDWSPADNYTTTKMKSHRLRRARWWKRFRTNVHQVIDGIFSAFLTGYQLPHNSRWSLFAEMFWVECPVCLFWRGVTFGFLLASFLAAVAVFIIV
jgi:hypothetical protein